MRTVDRIKEIIETEKKLVPLYEEIRKTASHEHSQKDLGKALEEKKNHLNLLERILTESRKCPSVIKKDREVSR
jgi:rubrerythrin